MDYKLLKLIGSSLFVIGVFFKEGKSRENYIVTAYAFASIAYYWLHYGWGG